MMRIDKRCQVDSLDPKVLKAFIAQQGEMEMTPSGDAVFSWEYVSYKRKCQDVTEAEADDMLRMRYELSSR